MQGTLLAAMLQVMVIGSQDVMQGVRLLQPVTARPDMTWYSSSDCVHYSTLAITKTIAGQKNRCCAILLQRQLYRRALDVGLLHALTHLLASSYAHHHQPSRAQQCITCYCR